MQNEKTLVTLYVEDNLAHAKFILRYLKKKQIVNQIIHLSDGQQALDYLFCQGKYEDLKDSPRPHLILLDLRLPKVDGLEILKRIKSDDKLCCIPTVILSTSGAEADMTRAYRLHANSYLVKPLDIAKLTEMLDSFGFYWSMWNKYSTCYGTQGKIFPNNS